MAFASRAAVDKTYVDGVGATGSRTDLIFAAATELTIAAGAVTATQGAHRIDTEADAASDDLDTISGGTAEEVIWIRPENAARTVVLKHNTGNIICPGAVDIPLADANDYALLVFANSKWTVVGYSTLAAGGGFVVTTGTQTLSNKTHTDVIMAAATELTIAAGVVTATQGAHRIDTEADAASDDLDTISGGTAEELLVIRPENGARTVVVKHNTGNIICPAGEDITLADASDMMLLVYRGAAWTVLAFSTLTAAGGGLGAVLASVAAGKGASAVGVEDSATLYTAVNVEAALAEVRKVGNAGLVVPYTVPVYLSTAASEAVVGRFTAPYAGKISAVRASVIRAATTTDKTCVLGATISDTAVSGGAVTITTATTSQSLGSSISGTEVSDLNSFTAGQVITIVVRSAAAQHAEGEVLAELFLASA